MGITFNANEIFEIAEEMERNGAKFYKEASEKATGKSLKKMFLDLAKIEQGHLKMFQKMRLSLSKEERESDTFDPDNEAGMYLQTMADMKGTEGKVSRNVKLSGKETPREMMEIALHAEKDSVIFYCGVRNFVPETAGRAKVDKIIKEELSHISELKKYLSKIS